MLHSIENNHVQVAHLFFPMHFIHLLQKASIKGQQRILQNSGLWNILIQLLPKPELQLQVTGNKI